MHITKINPKVNDISLTNQIKSHSLLYAVFTTKMLSWRKISTDSDVQFSSDT